MLQTFHIVPATIRSLWAVAAVAIAVGAAILVTFLFAKSMSGARSSRFELSDEGLRIRGDIYGRFLPASALKSREARRVDLSDTSPYRPRARTAGTALPGYRAGWFRLANGEKALLYVTDPSQVVYVPTSKGYSILLSVQETDAFVDRLHALAGP